MNEMKRRCLYLSKGKFIYILRSLRIDLKRKNNRNSSGICEPLLLANKPHLLTTINKYVAWEQVVGVQELKKKKKNQSTGFW